MITLEQLSKTPPNGARALLTGLGNGDSGFGGTAFGTGKLSFPEFLRLTMKQANAEGLTDGWVPQTTFWITKDGTAVGILRMRHHLNDALKIRGGHIGYYITPSARQQGIATEALRLALLEIEKLNVSSVMLTTSPENIASIKVIEQNGGTLTTQASDPDDGSTINQYWITR